uniref:Uncharacterized protein n=1 Tax=Octactis speculum TaxID=3111310 RepID=A0A7S2FT00_9STRA|mmetsp:Transcript_28696/g.39143  ORF Transcript_28696/g.39143 Transcript_28696/m.39143 type:complete len:205 (+) Transcript_28696:46-660(+)
MYLEASEMGYEVAQSNAAHLLQRGLVTVSDLQIRHTEPSSTHNTGSVVTAASQQDNGGGGDGGGGLGWWIDYEKLVGVDYSPSLHWALHFHRLAVLAGNADSLVALGDACFAGRGMTSPDYEAALWWYSHASAKGVPAGAQNLGYLYERGIGVEQSLSRAERHYRHANKLAPPEASWSATCVLYISLGRLQLKRLLGALGFPLS